MKTKLFLGAMALAFNGYAFSAIPSPYMTDSGVAITPQIDAGVKYDDNIFNQDDDTTSSSIFTVAPAITFSLDDGINNYNIDLGIESGTYTDSSDDNYLTGNIAFNSHLEASSRSRFDIKLEAKSDIETRGTGITEGLGDAFDEPLEYNDQTARLGYEYGALSASGRIALFGKYYNKDYTNLTAITEFRSFDQSTLGSTFFYTTNANSDAFIELKGSSIDYDKNQAVSRDSDVFSALIGITWEATALTSGSFKIGQEQKTFSDSAREDFKGVSWEGSVNWQPLQYTEITFVTSRQAKDPDVQGDYILESLYGINWKHSWSDLISSNINFSYMDEEYSGIQRTDKTNDLYLDVAYEFKKGSDVSIFYKLSGKDSTNENVIYDKNVIGLNFSFSL